MKFFLLAFLLFFVLGFAPAKAETENTEQRMMSLNVNGVHKADPYEIPAYDGFNINNIWSKNKSKKNERTKIKPASSNTPALTIINEPYIAPVPKAEPVLKSLTIRDNTPTALTPMPLTADIVTTKTPEPAIKAETFTETFTETWRGRKGESLHTVLSRWSERAGRALTWSSTNSPTLPKDISFIGRYEDAVNEAIRVSGAQDIRSKPKNLAQSELIIEPPVMAPLTPEPLTPLDLSPIDKGVTILDSSAPVPLEPIAAQPPLAERAKFYALAGTSLEQVLRAWSAGSDEFSLVWDAPHNFQVKDTLSSNGDIVEAIRALLAPFEGDKIRPVGKLYRDPKSAKPVLLVSAAK